VHTVIAERRVSAVRPMPPRVTPSRLIRAIRSNENMMRTAAANLSVPGRVRLELLTAANRLVRLLQQAVRKPERIP